MKVAQCAAEDELYERERIESEQLELVLLECKEEHQSGAESPQKAGSLQSFSEKAQSEYSEINTNKPDENLEIRIVKLESVQSPSKEHTPETACAEDFSEE